MSGVLNIIFREQADSLFDDLAVSLGVKMTFYSSSLEPVNRGRHNHLSAYCAFIQDQLGLGTTCQEEDRIRCHEARDRGDINCYTCHAGLKEVVVPVILEESVLGYALMGQIRGTDSPPPPILSKAEKHSGGRQALLDAYENLPRFSLDQFEHSVSLFKHVVTYMTEKHMVGLRSNLIIERALSYMEEHLTDNISLSQVADFTGRSPSSLSRHFKIQLGRNFKEILLDMKFKKAEKLFATNSGLSISQVSYELGFSEPAYFCRIYKKYRGMTPRQAINYILK
jgi:AraC-like DNA-binding protein